MFKFAGPHTQGPHMHVCYSQHSVVQTPDTNQKLGDKTNGDFFCQSLPYTQEQYVEFQNKQSSWYRRRSGVEWTSWGTVGVFLMQQLVGRTYKPVHLF